MLGCSIRLNSLMGCPAMSRLRVLSGPLAALVAGLCLFPKSPVGASSVGTWADEFTFTDIGPAGTATDGTAFPTGINALGQVMGLTGGNLVLYDGGTTTTVNPGLIISVLQLNNFGAGAASEWITGVRAGRFDLASRSFSTAPGGEGSICGICPNARAIDINDDSQLLFIVQGAGITRAYVGSSLTGPSPSALIQFSTGPTPGYPLAINGVGSVLGPDYLVSAGVRSTLPITATAFNDAHQVAGYTTAGGSDTAVVWDAGTITQYGSGRLVGINQYGDAIGINQTGSGPLNPFVVRGGTRTDLLSLLTLPSAWTITRVVDINDSGLIVGIGTPCTACTPHAFLLTPMAASTPVFSTAPTDQTAALSESSPQAQFSVVADGVPAVSYQWELLNGSTWEGIVANSAFSGVTTNRLVVTPTDTSLNGLQVRATATNSADTTVSAPATLTVVASADAPTFSVQPASVVGASGQTATLTAQADGAGPIRYQWFRNGTAVPGATQRILRAVALTTAHGSSYTVVATNSAGSTTSDAASITMLTSVSPSSLTFAATRSGLTGPLVKVTSPQAVTIAYAGPGMPGWTATSNQPWLTVSPPSGSGTAEVTLTVGNPGNVLNGQTSASAIVTITSSGIATTVTASLSIRPAGTTVPPVGQFETPALNATLQGAIAVSGWVVDDIGIATVKIYRTCQASDVPSNCQSAVYSGAPSLVFVGDAVFVPGARPDVEAAFSQYPASQVAGWGYLLLTNMLPRTTGAPASTGGQGPIDLYAVATDLEGNAVGLPRSWDQAVQPTGVILDNDAIAKPFGAIDTPAQGGVVSGTAYGNYGWAISPDSLIPLNGSTMVVFVDGVPLGTVAYNQCRGTVGNPVPPVAYCDDDVANLFGNSAPAPPFTPRLSNPSRYPNLSAERGPQGGFFLNTAGLAPGLHTIAWSVTDSGNRTEGIGSRYFRVLTPGDQPLPRAALQPAADVPLNAVYGRAGFDLTRAWSRLHPGDDGVRRVTISDLGRLEIRLGHDIDRGYLRVGEERRDLPPGSSLVDGIFHWMPGPGFLGAYTFEFSGPGGRADVQVRVRPSSTRTGESQIRMHLDSPGHASWTRGVISVEGWALDPDAFSGSGIGAVHVWAVRRDQPLAKHQFLGVAELGVFRPDVASAFGATFGQSGFAMRTTLGPGVYDITAFVWNERTGKFEDARTGRVTIVR